MLRVCSYAFVSCGEPQHVLSLAQADDDDEEEFDVLDDKVLRMETENQMKLLADEDPSKAQAAGMDQIREVFEKTGGVH